MDNNSHSLAPPVSETEQGYIALLAITILGVVSLGMTIGLQSKTLSHSLNITGNGNFIQAVELARSCLENAQLKLIMDPQYSGGEIVSIGQSNCTVISLTKQENTTTVISEATYFGSRARLITTLDKYAQSKLSQKLTN